MPFSLKIGDEVVHQSHPGRFTIIRIEPRPAMNVYSDIITIQSADGVAMRVLDTSVRKVARRPAPDDQS